MSASVSQSITRKSASNLALAFALLPREKRQDMAALYAFCRQVDDVADEERTPSAQRRHLLAQWREDVHAACNGGTAQFPVNRELQPVIARYHLPFGYFDDLLQGVEMDLDQQRYPDYEQLDTYCYRVASVVGLLSIEIFGYQDIACRDYAIALGKALQLTNILRDVQVDAGRGRLYLPLSELHRFNVSAEEILGCAYSPRYRELADSVAERARAYFRQARLLLPAADRRSMAAAELMGTVYWHLLGKLTARGFNVFVPGRVRISKAYKLFLILRGWWRLTTDNPSPTYG